MIVDSSAMISLLREEPETAWIEPIMHAHFGTLKMSVANYLESAIVIDGNGDAELSQRLDRVVDHFQIELVPVSRYQVALARDAYAAFGKGNHPARLNFGDCFAYALAKESGEPLLFKGADFAQTDIEPAR